jgi:hypothetical protein
MGVMICFTLSFCEAHIPSGSPIITVSTTDDSTNANVLIVASQSPRLSILLKNGSTFNPFLGTFVPIINDVVIELKGNKTNQKTYRINGRFD